MTKNILLLFLLILIGVMILWFFLSGLVRFYDPCEEAKEFYNLKFDGVIVEKTDATPLFKSQYLLIKNNEENSQTELYLSYDSNINKGSDDNQFWKIVNIGDSVAKNKETFFVNYKNVNSEWVHMKLGFKLCP